NGHDLSKMGSVASFFVSRVDSEYDQRLDKIGTPEAEALRGKAAIANAQLAYQLYENLFGTERWQDLANAGALPQRPLWASTTTMSSRASSARASTSSRHAARKCSTASRRLSTPPSRRRGGGPRGLRRAVRPSPET